MLIVTQHPHGKENMEISYLMYIIFCSLPEITQKRKLPSNRKLVSKWKDTCSSMHSPKPPKKNVKDENQ